MQSLITLAMYQVLSSHMCLLATYWRALIHDSFVTAETSVGQHWPKNQAR